MQLCAIWQKNKKIIILSIFKEPYDRNIGVTEACGLWV